MKILSLRAVTMIAATIGWTFPQALAAQSPTPRDTSRITTFLPATIQCLIVHHPFPMELTKHLDPAWHE